MSDRKPTRKHTQAEESDDPVVVETVEIDIVKVDGEVVETTVTDTVSVVEAERTTTPPLSSGDSDTLSVRH